MSDRDFEKEHCPKCKRLTFYIRCRRTIPASLPEVVCLNCQTVAGSIQFGDKRTVIGL